MIGVADMCVLRPVVCRLVEWPDRLLSEQYALLLPNREDLIHLESGIYRVLSRRWDLRAGKDGMPTGETVVTLLVASAVMWPKNVEGPPP